jgi:type IV secretion system protein VirD4
MNPRGQSVDNDLVNLGLFGIAALGCLAAALRLAGTVTAWAPSKDQPTYGWASGLRVLADPDRPGKALDAPAQRGSTSPFS